MDEQQTSAETADTEGSAAPGKAAPEAETVDPVKHKALLDSHAQQGRELKAAIDARVKAEARAAEYEAEREKARYESMNEDEKDSYRRQKDSEAKEAPKTQNLKNEKDLLRVIAETDDPKITKALSALYWRSEERGKFPDKDTVEALVEGLIPDEEEAEEPVEKAPPKVTAVAGTRGATPSLADELKAAEKSVQLKDGKYTYGEVLGLRSQLKAQNALANKG